MIFNVIGLLIGIAVLLAGLFYMVKEKKRSGIQKELYDHSSYRSGDHSIYDLQMVIKRIMDKNNNK